MDAYTPHRNEVDHVTVRLPAALHGALKARAVDEGRLLTAELARAVTRYLDDVRGASQRTRRSRARVK